MRNMSDIVRNQDPVTLPPSATVREACRYMRDRRVGAVLVTEGITACWVFSRDAMPFTACWQRVEAQRGQS